MNPSETLAPPRADSLRVGALNQGEIAAHSTRAGEPEFLARRRATAWAYCEKTPFPARTEELWRRTDIRSLSWEAVIAVRDPHPAVASVADLSAPLRAEIETLMKDLKVKETLYEEQKEALKKSSE